MIEQLTTLYMRATEYYESFNNQEYRLYKLKLQTLYKNERVTGILNAKVESNRQIGTHNVPRSDKHIAPPPGVGNQPTNSGAPKQNPAPVKA